MLQVFSNFIKLPKKLERVVTQGNSISGKWFTYFGRGI